MNSIISLNKQDIEPFTAIMRGIPSSLKLIYGGFCECLN